MKTNNNRQKSFFQMDERSKMIAYRVMSVMYLLTITALTAVVIYRQFVLAQEVGQFEDIAIIMTFNSLFLISALLYFGAVVVRKLSIKSILLFYLGFVALGTIFTYVKYQVIRGQGLSLSELAGKFGIIVAITGIITAFFIMFSILGNRRIDREME